MRSPSFSSYASASMLDPDDVIYFLHIPKTAGTSLIAWFSGMFQPGEVCPHFDPTVIRAASLAELEQYRFFAGHFGMELPSLLRQSPRIITWLRDPTHRLLSGYHYLRDLKPEVVATITDPSSRRQHEAACGLSFDAWVRLPDEGYYLHDLVAHTLAGPKAWGAQVLPAAIQALESFDHVGLVERMQDSVDILCHRFAWRPRVFNYRINTSQAGRHGLIKPDTLAVIRQRSSRDSVLYEHGMRLLDQRWQDMLGQLAEFNHESFPDKPGREWIHQALENAYSAGRGVTQATVAGRVSLVGLIDGRGWMPPTSHAGTRQGLIRWSGPETESDLFIPLDRSRDHQVDFLVLEVMDDEILRSLRFSSDGHPIDLRILAEPQAAFPRAHRFSGVIPLHASHRGSGLTRLSWCVTRTYPEPVASNPGHGPKILGFALEEISFTPVKAGSVLG